MRTHQIDVFTKIGLIITSCKTQAQLENTKKVLANYLTLYVLPTDSRLISNVINSLYHLIKRKYRLIMLDSTLIPFKN